MLLPFCKTDPLSLRSPQYLV